LTPPVEEHRATLDAAGELTRRRADQQVQWMWAMVRDRLMDRLRSDPGVREALPGLEHDVRAGGLTPTLAAEQILECLGLDGPGEARRG
jgi:LAO/AO transport system kinase